MANRRIDPPAALEVIVKFEPTRISRQMLERAYELLLPIQRRQGWLITSQLEQSQIEAEQAPKKKEVA